MPIRPSEWRNKTGLVMWRHIIRTEGNYVRGEGGTRRTCVNSNTAEYPEPVPLIPHQETPASNPNRGHCLSSIDSQTVNHYKVPLWDLTQSTKHETDSDLSSQVSILEPGPGSTYSKDSFNCSVPLLPLLVFELWHRPSLSDTSPLT